MLDLRFPLRAEGNTQVLNGPSKCLQCIFTQVKNLKFHVKLLWLRYFKHKWLLLCGSIVDITSFSDITSWQKWSPMLARMYFAVSRSRPTTFFDKGSHKLIASGSYLFGVKKPSSRSNPCLLNCNLRERGGRGKEKNPLLQMFHYFTFGPVSQCLHCKRVHHTSRSRTLHDCKGHN